MMKKTIAIILSLVMLWGLSACGNSTSQAASLPAGGNSTESIAATEKLEGSAATKAVSTENKPTNHESTEASEYPPEETEPPAAQEHRVLVAYFSATKTTEGVAEQIASGLNADLYEIVPVDPYTDADLDYHDSNSRTTIEMNDPDARPEISGAVENMEQYDIVFIGYPIWWGEAPRILSTFMECYDFSGKTIVPFCTSGSSGIGSSTDSLEQLTNDAHWLPGMRFSGDDSQDTIMEWVNSLGLDLMGNGLPAM